jgi:hypothetical protein
MLNIKVESGHPTPAQRVDVDSANPRIGNVKIQNNHDEIIEATRRWICSMVIGLNLCPFARRVFQGNLIRYVVSDASDSEDLRTDLANELAMLATSPSAESSADAIETTVLIHPNTLARFDDYCYFLDVAKSLIRAQRLRGIIQIASFHPQFQFAGVDPGAVENYSNRSPFPMLHLLREQSITAAANANPDELIEIPKRNIATLRLMGLEKILEMQRSCARSPHAV